MSYYTNISFGGVNQYQSSFYAGESFGSSKMTASLHHMINDALNVYIQNAIMNIITQLLMNILQPTQNNELTRTQHDDDDVGTHHEHTNPLH